MKDKTIPPPVRGEECTPEQVEYFNSCHEILGREEEISRRVKEEELLDTPTYTVREWLRLQDFAVDMAEEARHMAETNSLEELQAKEDALKAAESKIGALLAELQEAKDIRKTLDRIEAQGRTNAQSMKNAAREGAAEGARKAVEKTIPSVYAKTANMSGEELEAATNPKTRSSGGGRKKERDLDDAQVKAVLAASTAGHPRPLMECCTAIIRKGGEYQNPYDKAKDLAAAVRRYCKRTETKATFKRQAGKWSAKS